MQNVECPATDNRGVIKGRPFTLHQHMFPKNFSLYQQACGKIIFHFLPCFVNLTERELLPKQGQTQGIAQLKAVEGGSLDNVVLASVCPIFGVYVRELI